MKARYLKPATFLIAILALLGIFFVTANTTFAVSAGDWRAGRIIDDELFYNNNAMSAQDIQNFLNSKVPNCDTNGSQPAREKGRPDLTHAQYAAMVGWHGPPYICLKDYHQVPRSDVVINNFSGSIPAGAISAAQIIKNASDAYGVNPKAILVLLQKESAGPLPVDTWPLQGQYRSAMGYACPDTAPCNPKYNGFYNQVTSAAERIRTYKNNPNSYRHLPFQWNSTVYYNPDKDRCGHSAVFIESRATAGLYNYTPYQPNQAALNNMYGTGDSCSAYGNRNFWRIWNDWFGSTSMRYTPLEDKRWMKLKNNTFKKVPGSSTNVDEQLPAGKTLYFVDKIFVGNQWYLRSQFDAANGFNKGVPQSEVENIPYEPFETPRAMKLIKDARKLNPHNESVSSERFTAGTHLRFKDKTLVNGEWFFRTEFDSTSNSNLAIYAGSVSNASYEDFIEPRYMKVTSSTPGLDPVFGNSSGAAFSLNSQHLFSTKMLVGKDWYYRTAADTNSNVSRAIPSTHLEDIAYEKLATPKWLRLKTNLKKRVPSTGAQVDTDIAQGLQIQFVDRIVVNGVEYYRSKFDHDQNSNKAFPVSALESIPYEPMESPRQLKLTKSLKKVIPATGQEVDEVLAKGMQLTFKTKVVINGEVYLRTEFDTTDGNDKAIPIRFTTSN